MKRFAKYFAYFIVLIALIAVVAPFVIPTEKITAELAHQANSKLNQTVTIQGPVRASLMPRPSLTIENIAVLSPEGSTTPEMIRVESVSATLDLKQLLKGTLSISALEINKPTIAVEVYNTPRAGGETINWQLLKLESKQDSETDTSSAQVDNSTKPSKSSLNDRLQISRISINSAAVYYIKDKELAFSQDDVDLSLRASHLKGPYSLAIELSNLMGHKIIIDGDLGKVSQGTPIPFQFSGQTSDEYNQINFNGNLQLPSDKQSLSVEAKLDGVISGKLVGGKQDKEVKISADTSISNGGFKLTNLQLKQGEQSINGTVVRDGKQGQLIIGLNGEAFDLSSFNTGDITLKSNEESAPAIPQTEAIPDEPTSKISGIESKVANIHNKILSSSNALKSLPPFSASLKIGQLTLSDAITANDLLVDSSWSPDSGKLEIKKAEAKVNKVGTLSITGSQIGDKTALNSSIKIEDLKSFYPPIKKSVPDTFGGPFTTELALKSSPDALSITVSKTEIAGSTINSGELLYKPDAATPLQVKIDAETINTNTLSKNEKGVATKTAQDEFKAAASPDKKPVWLTGIKKSLLLDALSISCDLSAKSVISGESSVASNLTAKGVYNKGALTIEKFSATLPKYSAAVEVVGGIKSVLLPMTGVDLNGSIKATGAKIPAATRPAKSASIDFTLSGSPAQSMDVSLSGAVEATNFDLIGQIEDLDSASFNPDLTGTLAVTGNSLKESMSLFSNGLVFKPVPFQADAQVLFQNRFLEIKSGRIKVKEAVDTTFSLEKSFDESRDKRLKARLSGKRLDVASIIDQSAMKKAAPQKKVVPKTVEKSGEKEDEEKIPENIIDLSSLERLDVDIKADLETFSLPGLTLSNMALELVADGNSLQLKTLQADAYEGRVEINGRLRPGETDITSTLKPHDADLSIKVSAVNLGLLGKDSGMKALVSGTLEGKQSIETRGLNKEQLFQNMKGSGEISLTKPVIGGINLDALADQLDRPNSPEDFLEIIGELTNGGQTAFEDIVIPSQLQRGIWSASNITARTVNQKSILVGQAVISLPTERMRLSGDILFPEQRNMPPIGIVVDGPFKKPVKEIKTDSIIRFFAQRTTQQLGRRLTEKLLGRDTVSPSEIEDGTVPPNNSSGQQRDVIKDAAGKLLEGLF